MLEICTAFALTAEAFFFFLLQLPELLTQDLSLGLKDRQVVEQAVIFRTVFRRLFLSLYKRRDIFS